MLPSENLGLGDFGDERLAKRGVCCAREWWRARICLRRLAGGRRSGIVGVSGFLANPRLTVAALLDGWGAAPGALALPETDEYQTSRLS